MINILILVIIVLGIEIVMIIDTSIHRPFKEPKDTFDPKDDREFQDLKESGKDGILLGVKLYRKKCKKRIPINIECR